MGPFLKKNHLIIPLIAVSLVAVFLFSSNNSNFNSIASIVSARSLINQYSNTSNLNSLSDSQKEDLVKRIDNESRLIGIELDVANKAIQALKAKKDSLQPKGGLTTQQRNALISQITQNEKNINTIKLKQFSLNREYQAKIKQCNSIKVAVQKQSCLKESQNITNSINDVKKQLAQTDNITKSIQATLRNVKTQAAPNTSEVALLDKQIAQKQADSNKIFSTVQEISVLRRTVQDSIGANNNNDPSLTGDVVGCTDLNASNWNSAATIPDGSCEYSKIKGCKDPNAKNFNFQAEEDDGSCEYEIISCLCDTGKSDDKKDAEQITKITARPTWFGGPSDPNMTNNETLSMGGYARNLNPDTELYIAWPMPGVNKKNPASPHQLPSVEDCFGPETETWSGEKIARANESLAKQKAEISYTDAHGNKKTVQANIVDRGPGDPNRWDASKKLWRELGVDFNKESPIEFDIKLIPSETMVCPAPNN